MKKESVPLSGSDAALQPFLEAAKESASSNISTLGALVSKVLSHADIFAGYDQLKLILTDALQQAGAEGSKLANTLDLFSYGTFADYKSATEPNRFITLTNSQIFKLRQLTVLTLAQTVENTDRLSYSAVQQALQLEENSRAVEEILISCLYSQVLSGRLCQKSKSLRLTAPLRSRDVPVSALPGLLESVRQLQARVTRARHGLTRNEMVVQQNLQQDSQYWKQCQAEQESKMPASGSGEAWSSSTIMGPSGFLTAEVTSAAAAMDVTGRRQKRSRGGLTSAGAGGASAFQL